jgi:hypothetical protein
VVAAIAVPGELNQADSMLPSASASTPFSEYTGAAGSVRVPSVHVSFTIIAARQVVPTSSKQIEAVKRIAGRDACRPLEKQYGSCADIFAISFCGRSMVQNHSKKIGQANDPFVNTQATL